MAEKKFLRQNWFLHPKLGKKWRRPRGKQSKLRKSKKGHRNVPSIGFSKCKQLRNLVKGYRTVLVSSVGDVERVGQGYAIIISSGVGKRKAIEIEKKANEKGLKIINDKKVHKAKRHAEKLEEKRKARLAETKTQSHAAKSAAETKKVQAEQKEEIKEPKKGTSPPANIQTTKEAAKALPKKDDTYRKEVEG